MLAVASLFIGVSDVSPANLWGSDSDSRAVQVLLASRIPRTLAIMLTGVSMSIAGLIMQLLVRNRFVEPSTAGTVDSATLGLLVVMLVAPGLPLMAKMGVATVFALAGTAVFLLLLRRIPLRSVVMVPLVGLMFGGVIGAATTFLAYRYDLLQSLAAWTTGDFSGIVRGRYELLWIALAIAALAYFAADRFTVAGLGQDMATNLGLSYRSTMVIGLTIVAIVTAVVVVTAGVVPFLGLIVPNVVSLIVGDNARRSVPWVAVLGAGFVLACDIIGRVVRFPYEIPMGVVVGVVGSILFLYLLLRSPHRVTA
ncbi:MAG: iron transporter permease [Homoserinimonas sp.]|nr:iron transporter permease [Homoserinimonas sp.]